MELAKQGDAGAIASLMNRQLQPKGITAKVAFQDACLQVMLESAQVPNQQALVTFVRKGITGLGAVSIERVKVYGRQTGEEFPAWSQELEICEQQSVVHNVETQQNQLSLKEQAKQGDVDNITTLLNIALQHKNITAKISLQDSCLQVMLESDQIPVQTSTTVVRREMMMIKPECITTVKIYGKQIGNEFPSWIQEFDILAQPNSNPTVTSQDKREIINQASTLKSPNLTISVNGTTINLSGVESILQSKILGVTGSIILFIGVFTPIVTAPMIGSLNYFHNGKGDGVVLLILAVISLILAVKEKYKWLWWTGLASLGVIIIGLINFQIRISQLKSNMEEELAGNPFKGFADVAIQSVQIQWGWVLLILGAGMIIAAAIIQEKQNIYQVGHVKYFSDLFNIKQAKKAYIFLGLVLIGVIIPKIFIEVSHQLEYNQQETKAKQSEAKVYIGSINRGQQIFHLEKDIFATTIEDLELSIRSETSNYVYNIASTDNSQAITTATAKEDGLRSYTGVVFLVKETDEVEMKTATCETNSTSKTPPENPQLVGNVIQCPSGSSQIDI
ncbi:type IV pilin-like G/H family protein [Komarekiella delphini-convector]|uniref:type IV pilin-like G/H family protein n=1 Tax=Komarekiella delphini-convector TaxID=3050158 RepID=UPI001782E678|nr:type IV pilin-like G/H family protein [Komarekiella delphini-convector]